jgi:lipoprotein signal peptidase
VSSIYLNFMPSKRWYTSKTIWFNALTILCTIAAFFGWTPDQDLTARVAGMLVIAGPLVNLILRLLTKNPIGPTTS